MGAVRRVLGSGKRNWTGRRSRATGSSGRAKVWAESSPTLKCPVGLCILEHGHTTKHVAPEDEYDGFRFYPRTELERLVARFLIHNRGVGLHRVVDLLMELQRDTTRPR